MASLEQLSSQLDSYRASINEQRKVIVSALNSIDPNLLERAIQVFGSEITAHDWLFTPNRSLDNTSPIESIAEGDRALILSILGRIEYGVVS